MTAEDVIALLGLTPHPEGGFFRETFRDAWKADGRSASTAIYYLLPAGQRSHWHRIDAAETWHFYAGAPLALSTSADGKESVTVTLGADLAGGERPQHVVPRGVWQSGQSLGDWTLIGCTVAPAFRFEGFEIAPDGWEPGG